MNCCDEYGDCNQGRDCPIRTRRVKPYPHTPEDLPIEMIEPEEKPMWFTVAFIIGVAGLILAGLFIYTGITK